MVNLRTPLCDLLGIDVPIIQAPIGSATTPALAAAVSNAGGLGMLAISWTDPEDIRGLLVETKRLTSRPFGVNLVLQWPQLDRLSVCLDEGVSLVSFHWGDAAPHVNAVHAAGALVAQSVGNAADARRGAEAGIDIIVAQGWEAGGHIRGEVATLPLVPAVVDAVPRTPVVAAGGIADGRGIAAVLALGAAGAWVGTRFLATDEAAADDSYKEAVCRATETETLYSSLFDGGWPDAPHRTLRNSTTRRWEEHGRPPSGRRPGESEAIAAWPNGEPILRYEDTIPLVGMTGDLQALALYAGQSAGLVSRVRPAGEVVTHLAEEALAVMKQLGRE